jgi:hypothetical protein
MVFGKRRAQLAAVLDNIRESLDQLDRRVDKMETILIIREPSSVAAGDAYEGLRKQVMAALSERLAHLSQLVQLHAAVAGGADARVLSQLVDAWFEQAALLRVDDPGHPQAHALFEVVEDKGGAPEVLDPAYVDSVTGRVIRPGRIRRLPVEGPHRRGAAGRTAKEPAAPAKEPSPEPADDGADEPTLVSVLQPAEPSASDEELQ